MKEKWESECVSVVYKGKQMKKKRKSMGKVLNMIGKF